MYKRTLFLILLISTLLFTSQPVKAQEITGPVYIVQSGDSLSSIAGQFNVSVTDLMAANNITNPNLLTVDQQLVIPGIEGVSGVLQTKLITFGDSFRSFVRHTQMPAQTLVKLITSRVPTNSMQDLP